MNGKPTIRVASDNERAIAAFAAQFTPPLKYVRTERINGVAMTDAWQCSYWDGARSIGITTVAYGGGIHAYIEAAGRGEIAGDAGRVIAKALDMFSAASNAQALAQEIADELFDGDGKAEPVIGQWGHPSLITAAKAQAIIIIQRLLKGGGDASG
jgi:hypothetical protein